MKPKGLLLLVGLVLVPALFIVAFQIGLQQQQRDYLQGNVLSEEEAGDRVLPNFRDDVDPSEFSYYLEDATSLGALVDRYQDAVDMPRALRISDRYAEPIVAFVSAVARQTPVHQLRYLPFAPETNRMTYEMAAIVLFPEANSPLEMAKEKGVVAAGVLPDAYISRFEYFQMVAQRFFEGKRVDAVLAYQQSGLVADVERWQDRSQEGFLVVDGLAELNIPLLVAQDVSYLQASQARYAERMIDLPQEALTFSADTLRLLLRAADREGEFDAFQNQWKASYGEALSSVLVASLLEGTSARVRTLPKELYLGECTQSLYRKLQLGGLVAIGPQGTILSCLAGDGIVRVELSPSSLVVNAYQLPAVQSVPAADGAHLVFLDFPALVENLLLLGPDGEERLKVSYTPFDRQSFLGESAGLALKSDVMDFEGMLSSYNEEGKVVFFIPLRALKAGNIQAYVQPVVGEL